jgi:hypothetical protein
VQVVASAATRISVFLLALAAMWSLATLGFRFVQDASLPTGYAPGVTAPTGPEAPVAQRDSDASTDGSNAPAEQLPTVPASAEATPPQAPVEPSRQGTVVSQVPRVALVSQFDGGRMQSANCTLAAGAMLAKSSFGIDTTGSELRDLQFDQVGGTDLVDLQTALHRGYGVTVVWNAIRTDELRALLSVGAGVVIQGDYSRIPIGWRLQRDFEGGHAIYLDAYFAGEGSTPSAYFVIDPLGSRGYEGAWWHASVVDEFAAAFAGPGRIAAVWAPR